MLLEPPISGLNFDTLKEWLNSHISFQQGATSAIAPILMNVYNHQEEFKKRSITQPGEEAKPYIPKLLFAGTSGCGKTLMGDRVKYCLGMNTGYKYVNQYVEIDASTYRDETQTNRLIGAGPGYSGHDEFVSTLPDLLIKALSLREDEIDNENNNNNISTSVVNGGHSDDDDDDDNNDDGVNNKPCRPNYDGKKVVTRAQTNPIKTITKRKTKKTTKTGTKTTTTVARRNPPYIVICFDEIDKAHHTVPALLNGLLDKGEIQSSRNTQFKLPVETALLCIFTSNFADNKISALIQKQQQAGTILVEEELKNRSMQWCTIERFGQVVTFFPLDEEQLKFVLKPGLKKYISDGHRLHRLSRPLYYEEEALDKMVSRIAKESNKDKGIRCGLRLMKQYLDSLFEAAFWRIKQGPVQENDSFTFFWETFRLSKMNKAMDGKLFQHLTYENKTEIDFYGKDDPDANVDSIGLKNSNDNQIIAIVIIPCLTINIINNNNNNNDGDGDGDYNTQNTKGICTPVTKDKTRFLTRKIKKLENDLAKTKIENKRIKKIFGRIQKKKSSSSSSSSPSSSPSSSSSKRNSSNIHDVQHDNYGGGGGGNGGYDDDGSGGGGSDDDDYRDNTYDVVTNNGNFNDINESEGDNHESESDKYEDKTIIKRGDYRNIKTRSKYDKEYREKIEKQYNNNNNKKIFNNINKKSMNKDIYNNNNNNYNNNNNNNNITLVNTTSLKRKPQHENCQIRSKKRKYLSLGDGFDCHDKDYFQNEKRRKRQREDNTNVNNDEDEYSKPNTKLKTEENPNTVLDTIVCGTCDKLRKKSSFYSYTKKKKKNSDDKEPEKLYSYWYKECQQCRRK